MSKIFYILLLLCMDYVQSEPEIEKILRIQFEDNGYKTVTMSDGELIVNFLLNSQGGIEDCKSLRRRRMLLGMLKYDLDHVGGEENVVYLDQDIDVQWYARQCTRFLRQIQVPGQSGFENIVLKQKVNQAYEGTKFCSRFGSNYNPKYNEGNDAPDECCKIYKSCDFHIPYLNQRHGFLNVEMYDIVDCTCLQQFKSCLSELKDEKAREIHQIFFELLNMKCFELKAEQTCLNYSTWFDQCTEEFSYLTLSIQRPE